MVLFFSNLSASDFSKPLKFPGIPKFSTDKIKAYYPIEYPEIQRNVSENYFELSKDTKFALNSKNPMDKRLDFCSYFLALIKTLDQRNENY